MKAAAIGALGIGLVSFAKVSQAFVSPLASSVLRDWLPAPLMLMAYWQAGQLFTKPWQRFQSKLEALDEKWLGSILRVQSSGRVRAWLFAYFELAYLLCYPLVPCTLAVLYLKHMGRYADQLWTAVLPPAYICYGLVPFIRTLPPRMLSSERALGIRPSQIRALNLSILNHASIQVNTFPCAHVAASMAASLALLCFVPWAGLLFLCVSISIAVGAVLGRYHYALDTLAGAALAVAGFLLGIGCF